MANFFVAEPLQLGQHIRICLPRCFLRASNFIHLRKSTFNSNVPRTQHTRFFDMKLPTSLILPRRRVKLLKYLGLDTT